MLEYTALAASPHALSGKLILVFQHPAKGFESRMFFKPAVRHVLFHVMQSTRRIYSGFARHAGSLVKKNCMTPTGMLMNGANTRYRPFQRLDFSGFFQGGLFSASG